MPISVNDWYKNVQFNEVSLAAGADGIDNVIQRVHFIEKSDLSSFLNGHELIFTTGVAFNDEAELTDLVRTCFDKGVSAIVVNIGTYIKKIPAKSIAFCNDNGLPLFTVPWHVHLEELTQLSYQLVSAAIKPAPTALGKLFENAINFPEMHNLYVSGLREQGFKTDWKYCSAILKFPADLHDIFSYLPQNQMLEMVNRELKKESFPCYAIFHQHTIVIIYANVSSDIVERSVTGICHLLEKILSLEAEIIFGIGRSTKSARCISKSYDLAQQIVNMKQNHMLPDDLHSYDSLGVFKVVMALGSSEVLNEIMRTYYDPLMSYDKAHGTDYCQFMQYFIKYDGRIKDIAGHMFVHRNTVHYKVHKIEEILGCDLQRSDTKMYMLIAFMSHSMQVK